MNHTFITPAGKEKTVTIPDEHINKLRLNLGLTTAQAVQMFLEDEGYFDNDEQTALDDKAKAAGVVVRNAADGKRKAPTRKPDEAKRELIAHLFEAISELPQVENAKVTNIERMIAFSIGDDDFEITLSKKRKPKA